MPYQQRLQLITCLSYFFIFRATAYGIWSLLVPVGYNRDPTAHFGYKKVAMIFEQSYMVNEEEVITEKDIARSRGESRIPVSKLNINTTVLYQKPD